MAARATERFWFLDTLVMVRVAHRQGEDGISVLESWAPFGDSPPLHVHRTEDEVFHLLQGELRLSVGGDELRLRAGETGLAPKGVPHTYRVESRDGARWLVTTTRGDFEQFVRELARPAPEAVLPAPSGPPTAEQADSLAVLAERHEIELVGPPLS